MIINSSDATNRQPVTGFLVGEAAAANVKSLDHYAARAFSYFRSQGWEADSAQGWARRWAALQIDKAMLAEAAKLPHWSELVTDYPGAKRGPKPGFRNRPVADGDIW